MKKQKNNRGYFLGVDNNGHKYYLKPGNFDCGWYWGFGYIEEYDASKWQSLQHFSMFFSQPSKCGYDTFKEFFKETPLDNKEIWILCDLMKSYYAAREYSDMLYIGGAHYTTNPCKKTIQGLAPGEIISPEYTRINKVVIPAIMDEVYKLLTKSSYLEELKNEKQNN